jgi:serine protease
MRNAIRSSLIGLALCSVAHAAKFTISSTSGRNGDATPITVSATGDGRTNNVLLRIIFDESKLTLPVASGVIDSAGRNGAVCSRIASNTLQVAKLGFSDPVLPNAQTPLCVWPFSIAARASTGRASLEGTAAECYSTVGTVPECSVQNGAVQVSGINPLPWPAPAPSKERLLAVMLKASGPGVPTVEALTRFNYAGNDALPLAAFNSARPVQVISLLPIRAAGDYARYLQQYPNTASAKLERYAVVKYRDDQDLAVAEQALRADAAVEYVHSPKPRAVVPPTPTPTEALSSVAAPAQPWPALAGVAEGVSKSTFNQYHLNMLNVPAANNLAGGWALVGLLDTGLQTEHPDLRSFSGPGSVSGTSNSGLFLPGNFLPAFSLDVSELYLRSAIPAASLFPFARVLNVDEREPAWVPGSVSNACDVLDGVDDEFGPSTFAGHGTHTSGLVSASLSPTGTNEQVQGVCKSCGIAMMAIARWLCFAGVPASSGVTAIPAFIYPAIDDGIANGFVSFGVFDTSVKTLTAYGAQVINMSFGSTQFGDEDDTPCSETANAPDCLALSQATESDVLLVGSSGNSRERIHFPAMDRRVAAVGGVDAVQNLWDESPFSTTFCPPDLDPLDADPDPECGSNFRQSNANAQQRQQEIVVPARGVRSTVYTGVNYNESVKCGDLIGTDSSADGVGLCTGTSMSAPIASGMYGLLRSINPLLRASYDQGFGPAPIYGYGVRNVVIDTASRSAAGLGRSDTLGFGIPDAAAAARKILGTVNGIVVANRATPLFALYSPGTDDYAATATPQGAMSLARYQAAAYQSTGSFIQGAAIPQYTEFPHETGTPSPQPRARAYVMTTENAPAGGAPLKPLYYMDRERPWPLGCTSGAACNLLHRDFILLTDANAVQNLSTQGFRYRGVQGYVFPNQVANSKALLLMCNAAKDDCAVVLDNAQKTQFITAGYNRDMPNSSTVGQTILGYAFDTDDIDIDQLPDAMEYLIGLSTQTADTDSDGLTDAQEFPLAGVSLSDPCNANGCSANQLFRNGFE